MNKLFLFLMIVGYNVSYAQQKTQADLWSGTYVVNPKNEDRSANVDTLVIAKTVDADPNKLAARYTSDLARWTLTSKKEGDKERQIVRRFLFDIENKEDAYAEFGWTDLHKNGKMNCIDGGHFFI